MTFMELVDPLRKLSNLINSYHNHVQVGFDTKVHKLKLSK